jgi:hypothetical protein
VARGPPHHPPPVPVGRREHAHAAGTIPTHPVRLGGPARPPEDGEGRGPDTRAVSLRHGPQAGAPGAPAGRAGGPDPGRGAVPRAGSSRPVRDLRTPPGGATTLGDALSRS